ncbi:uncharacterized protein [Euwallacea similis]|uniref:uncharacterized protein n=1 Tax=Euwallacea similis TaxID=1736056 RepID=UPI003450AB68
MIVPPEILELILLKCDGKTLLAARKVCNVMKETIDYLTRKTRLWEWCCKEEIPADQLTEYLLLYLHQADEKWLQIYQRWSSWEFYTPEICDPKLCPNNSFKRVSTIAVSSDHIAVGSEDGRLKLYTSHWHPVFEHRVMAVKLTKLTFIGYHDYDDVINLDICIVVAFHKGISIVSFNGFRKEQYDIRDVKSHSIYGNYLCIEKVGGRMTILEVTKLHGRREIKEIWFTRIYSPRCITSYQMWNEKCVVLINGTVTTVNYKKSTITPMEEMKKVVDIKFHAPLKMDSSTTQILRNNVIINIYKNASCQPPDVIEDYVEIVILTQNKKYSKKLFNTWEIFKSDITCTYLFGNTFVVATACGMVYFYRVSNWKNFDMHKYISQIIVGKHPIISIAMKETANERKFYVCSRFAIHEITCWLPCVRSD